MKSLDEISSPLNVLQEVFLVDVTCLEFCREITWIALALMQACGRWICSAKVQHCLSSGLRNHSKHLFFVQVLGGGGEDN